MQSRRDFLKRLLALVLLPAGLAAPETGAARGRASGW
jgi:hypothetical protein